MVTSFIMIDTIAGASDEILPTVRDLKGVREAHIVAGDYDIIAEIETDEVYEVLETVASGVRSLEGVADTKTYVALG